jgi:asparagine synthetase B (glutamine-hydrolysing)
MWLITNRSNVRAPRSVRKHEFPGYSLFVEQTDHLQIESVDDKIIVIDGYILPRRAQYDRLSRYPQLQLIRHLMEEKTELPTDAFKGIFALIIAEHGGFSILSDHLGLKKYFYHLDNNQFIITDNLYALLDNISPAVSRSAIVSHVLLNHYINGQTLAEGVIYSGMAQTINFDGRELSFGRYWRPADLIPSRITHDYADVADHFSTLIADYLSYLHIQTPSVAATGGLDCRLIIAALLNAECRPITYTYGHPSSADVHFGRSAAQTLSLPYSHYYVEPTAQWYRPLVQEIWDKGQSLVSLHRAHRLYAVKQEAQKADALFFGYLGGELVRGMWPDDLIVSQYMRKVWAEGVYRKHITQDAFNAAFLRYGNEELETAEEILATIDVDSEYRYFRYLLQMVAAIHYAQDIMLFGCYRTVIPVFQDVDYLQVLFATKYSMLKQKRFSRSFRERLGAPEFHARVINRLNPRMATIPLGKHYTPAGYLRNKYVTYVTKYVKDRLAAKKYSVNFTYQNWFKDFLREGLRRYDRYAEYFHPLTDELEQRFIQTEKDAFPFSRLVDIGRWIELIMGDMDHPRAR